MNVTKTMAQEIAKKMIQPMADEIDKKQSVLQNYVETIVLNQIPVEVQKTFKKYRRYFNGCSSVYLNVGSAETRRFNVDYDKIPYNNNTNTYQCTNEQFDFVSKARKDLEVLKEERQKTEESIITTLLSLRTVKKVIEQFPSAAEYAKEYDEKKVTTLSLPISDIDKVLSKYKTK